MEARRIAGGCIPKMKMKNPANQSRIHPVPFLQAMEITLQFPRGNATVVVGTNPKVSCPCINVPCMHGLQSDEVTLCYPIIRTGSNFQNSFAVAMQYVVFITCILILLFNAYVAARNGLRAVSWEVIYVMSFVCECFFLNCFGITL